RRYLSCDPRQKITGYSPLSPKSIDLAFSPYGHNELFSPIVTDRNHEIAHEITPAVTCFFNTLWRDADRKNKR
ncbi:hypothetical protein, partial [Klebsiella pneumoniae]|uniref:hypothetical protein n=1 Tax=Klebsiella pneumoniae TaxID=573 RepID=UPI00195356E3